VTESQALQKRAVTVFRIVVVSEWRKPLDITDLWAMQQFRPPIDCDLQPFQATAFAFGLNDAQCRLAVEERTQLAAPRRVFELAQRLCFDLADAFTRHRELLADFLQRVVGIHADAETHAQHAFLARRQ